MFKRSKRRASLAAMGLVLAAVFVTGRPTLGAMGAPAGVNTPGRAFSLPLKEAVGEGGASAVSDRMRQALISPRLWAEMAAQGQADVLIVLREQADLSGAERLSSKEAKGRCVFDALRATAHRSQAPLVAYLRARGIPYQAFYLVNVLLVRGDRDLLRELAARPEVARLEANPRVRADVPLPSPDRTGTHTQAAATIPWGVVRVHAPEVWALGIRGKDVVVAGADTGIFWAHEALQASYRGWDGAQADHNTNWHDAISDQPVPYDDHGHGTLTLGTVVGEAEYERIGMAPAARWIGCKNMDAAGYGTPARYIECFQFFLAPYPHGGDPVTDGDPGLAPDVINNSWTCPPSEGCDADTLRAAVEAVRAAGIAVVVSAGNYGSGCGTVQYPPSFYDAAFSVGAFDSGDRIASFSSRGPVTADGSGRLKPDVAAPGVSVRSSSSSGGYGTGSGTSMAAPHVAGQVALMLAANSQLRGRVDVIEEIITQSAEATTATVACGGEPAGVVPNNTWGYGIIDALDAVQAALAWDPSTPTSTPTATAMPTATATPTATSTPAPGWRVYLPLLFKVTSSKVSGSQVPGSIAWTFELAGFQT